MLSIIRALLRLRDREHILRSNYHRCHPHFPIYIALDALLSLSLVFGVIQFSSAFASAPDHEVALIRAGAKLLSADELQSHVPLPIHQGSRYWLGEMAGVSYTTNCVTPGVLKVAYLANGKDIADPTATLVTITAYETQSILASELHSVREYEGGIVENARGDRLTFADSMKKMRILRVDSQEVVVIEYSSLQTASKMTADSEKLLALDY